MTVLDIVKFPDELLRKKSKEIVDFDGSLKKFSEDMVETMYASRGVGLAAVQVGALKRILVLDVTPFIDADKENENEENSEENSEEIPEKESLKNPEIFVNPEIISFDGKTEFEEGCLSLPGVNGVVKRAGSVRVKYSNIQGESFENSFSDYHAIVLQHEIDHLNGVLFFDHLGPLKRSLVLKKYEKLSEDS